MKESVSLNWLNNMAFDVEVNGHKLYVDLSEKNGGKNLGPRPKSLMLLSMGGCAGMDVVSILKKMRIEYDSLEIKVEGDLSEEHPKSFQQMKVIFSFKGNNIPLDKVQKAIDLSKERYCGVYDVFKKSMKIDFEIRINE